MVTRILNGDISTPYSSIITDDLWRMSPPLYMWWYVYHYFAHGLDPLIWRLITILLELGIIYSMFIFFEQSGNNANDSRNELFKIGLSFYSFSIFGITYTILYANAHILSIVLGFFGLIYYYKSKNDTNYLYYSIFFLTFSALTQYISFILIFGILLILAFQKMFDKIIWLSLEVLIIFCVVSFPLILNDSVGFFQHAFLSYKIYENSWNLAIWVYSDTVVWGILLVLTLGIITYYTYTNLNERGSLDYFIIILSIGLIFLPVLNFWNYLWILPLISINLIHSLRKYLIANIFILTSMISFFLLYAISALLYPFPLDPNFFTALTQILNYGESLGIANIFRLFGVPLFQIGLIYVIYSYTKSRTILFLILLPFLIFYVSNLLIWIGGFLY
ncbi:MAG: hypothetical protein ACTSRC_11635 [Candidatus Helarchaeota archaeon]